MFEYPDSELVNLVCERSEEARDVLYEKYKYIIDIIYNKYKRSAYYFSVDLNELRQEAMVGFSDAIVSYNQDKNSSLSTFISLCVERRVSNFIKKADTEKNRILKEAYSLDLEFDSEGLAIKDRIGDSTNDPQVKLEDEENLRTLQKKINELLSPTEKNVYELMLNDFSYEDIAGILNKDVKSIYNTAQRIRTKIREIL